MSVPAEQIAAALAAPLAALGVDVESVDVDRAGRRHVVRIVVDRDGGVDLDTVAEVSRAASAVLDAEPVDAVLPGPFVLEVSSPGVDRPLTLPRHWRRARGRLVTVELTDGSSRTGRIVGSDEDGARIDVDSGERAIAFADVRRAVVQVEFARPDADADADSDAESDADQEA